MKQDGDVSVRQLMEGFADHINVFLNDRICGRLVAPITDFTFLSRRTVRLHRLLMCTTVCPHHLRSARMIS